ncbi:MAG: hypothetical protein JST55_16235 [Bacteroidetes bacterium]|nr:hypothetical protein [Bacteroidota bacterium]
MNRTFLMLFVFMVGLFIPVKFSEAQPNKSNQNTGPVSWPPCGQASGPNWNVLPNATGLYTSGITDQEYVTVKGFLNYGSKLLVYGRFEYAMNNGVIVPNTKHVALWDGVKFEALINESLNWQLSACAFCACFYNGSLYIGGSNENLARINSGHWDYLSGWNGNYGININYGLHGRCSAGSETGEIIALEVFQNKLFVGGTFLKFGDNRPSGILTDVHGIICIDASGAFQILTTYGADAYVSSAGDCAGVYAMKTFNGELYIGGRFLKFNNINSNLYIKYNGSSWTPSNFTSVSGKSPVILDFMIKAGVLYMAGEFRTLYSPTSYVNHIAYLGTGGNWISVQSNNSSLTYGVDKLSMINRILDYNGDIIAIGPIYDIGTIHGYNGIARLSACDCSSLPVWYKLNTYGVYNTLKPNASVSDALASFQGFLYVGGSFTQDITGTPGDHMMYWRKCN